MEVTIVSVGDEIVNGDQVDSNAAWLSRRLREVGLEVRYHLAAGDDRGLLGTALRWALERTEAVVVGGGLGPTPDDLTREVVAEVTGRPLEARADLEEAILQAFASRGRRMPPSNLRQARIPAGAVALPPLGTAPGFRLDLDGGVLYALPGVPWELQGMATEHVLPDLLARVGAGAWLTRTVHVTGMGESAVAERVAVVVADADAPEDVTVSYLADERGIRVRVTARADTPEDARARTEPLVAGIRHALGRAAVGVDDGSVEQAVRDRLRELGQTVAVAESATAGGVTARLAEVPGVSAVLRGGITVYATDTKSGLLGVPEALLASHGPVSEPVTRELASRVRELFDSDWGVGVTGVAGPDPQGDRPVGTVVWAVAGPDGDVAVRADRFPGDRRAVQRRLASAALELLRRRLLDAPS